MNMKKLLIAMSVPVLALAMGANVVFAKGKGGGGGKPNGNLPAAVVDSDFHDNGNPGAAKVELGKNLMFDKILSGNRNISCATCHHSLTDTGDGLSLPVGEGGLGLGVTRGEDDEIFERVPRNAPPVWNLGATSMTFMFHDGRVSADSSSPSGCKTPAGNNLPNNMDNVLACQAMFPVTSATEMAGQDGENPIANAAANGNLAGSGGVWELLADRLQAIPEYVNMFIAAFDDIDEASDITYAHAANAISAFERVNWRADNSPFDRFLRGNDGAMSGEAKAGMDIFYGKGGCSSCHSGKFQTDMGFYAIAMPATGAGRGSGPGGIDDFGREQVTLDSADRYKFRTPPLRNVALTAPYGHGGAFDTLEGIVRHHLDPVDSLNDYDCENDTVLPSLGSEVDDKDCAAMNDAGTVQSIGDHNELSPVDLSDKEVGRLLDFLNALTDPSSIDLRSDTPMTVPSGLTLAE